MASLAPTSPLQPTPPPTYPAKTTHPKIPSLVAQTIEKLQAEDPSNNNFTVYSTDLLIVSADGALKLSIHSQEPIGKDKEAFLVSHRVQIISTTADTRETKLQAHILDAWVPYGMVSIIADQPWVVAITPIGEVVTN
jgi:hypothetical protein